MDTVAKQTLFAIAQAARAATDWDSTLNPVNAGCAAILIDLVLSARAGNDLQVAYDTDDQTGRKGVQKTHYDLVVIRLSDGSQVPVRIPACVLEVRVALTLLKRAAAGGQIHSWNRTGTKMRIISQGGIAEALTKFDALIGQSTSNSLISRCYNDETTQQVLRSLTQLRERAAVS